MKVYLVGGAVRDRLLGCPIKEQDWVVVGATPNQLLQQGYKQVGRDFPVFLHPKTKDEYALARTERKLGAGYYGFVCDFNPHVTLDEDLSRRDLTINAIAMDAKGHIIDPYQGMADLNGRILRHVSPAFIEDPVRVLRVARFAARFHHLGFKLAEETRALMYSMVKRGELAHLVPERVWQEWLRSLQEKNPELFITTLREAGALQAILPEIDALFGVPNSRHYHPEVDSGVHTIMVLKAAVELSNDPIIRFAALVHDLGKAKTPMAAWPSHHGHETRGISVIDTLSQRLRIPTEYRKFACMVSRHHLNIHRLFELRSQTIVDILERTDAFRRQDLFEKLLIVCEADAKGKGAKPKDYPQAQSWRYLLRECKTITATSLVEEGLQGEEIKLGLRGRRIAHIQDNIIWKKHET